jgi:3-carboxy-cis,cis-muconate cycloisomerase
MAENTSSARLIECLATTDSLAEIFSNQSVLQAMLDFEASLARAAARAGIVPEAAAHAISAAADASQFDAAGIASDARKSATPVIPLVAALTERVRSVDADAAQYVHWGVTSQDVADTAMILLLKRAQPLLAEDHARVDRALRDLSEAHAATVMLGRTLLQPATPITFGLKAAGWCAALNRSWWRLSAAWRDALVLEFGGAAGTRAAFGDRASVVAMELASDLGLSPAPPWHTDRDRIGAAIAAMGLFTAVLGKIARDIALLMQAEIGEVSEPGGGSSAMPHKRNPSGSVVVMAAATRMPGLVAAFLTGMVQEQERSIGGSQAEWPTIAAIVQTTGSAVAALATALEGLRVDAARMQANLNATAGVVFAERAVVLLGPALGRVTARQLVTEAVRRSQELRRPFHEVLRSMPEIAHGSATRALDDLDRPDQYLGDAEILRRQLLDESAVMPLEES